jgi:hypothetical protein
LRSAFPAPGFPRIAREGNGSSGPMGVKSIAKHLNLALPLQLERNRSRQAIIAWQQRAGPAEHSQGRKRRSRSRTARALTVHRWSGCGLPCEHGRTSCRARATRRYAANDGARNVDFECFLGSSGIRPLHTVPLQCHPKQCADRHLRPPTARSDIVAFILPSICSSKTTSAAKGHWSLLNFAPAAPDRVNPRAADFVPTPHFAGDTGLGRRGWQHERT